MVAIILVEAAYKLAAEVAARGISPESEGDSFTVPLRPLASSEASTSPTHWESLPIVTGEAAEQIRRLVESPPFVGHATVTFCEPDHISEAVETALSQWGLTRVE